MKKQIHQDVYIGIVALIFCAVVFFMNYGLKGDADVMPMLLDSLLAIFSVIILVGGLKKSKLPAKEQGEKFITLDAVKYPLLIWCLVVAYVVLFLLTGYLISTGVMLLVLMVFMKQRNWKVMLAIDAVYLAITYGVFVKLLSVNVGGLGLLGNLF